MMARVLENLPNSREIYLCSQRTVSDQRTKIHCIQIASSPFSSLGSESTEGIEGQSWARHVSQCRRPSQPKSRRRPTAHALRVHASASAAAAAPGLTIQRPGLFDAAPLKHRLPLGTSSPSPSDHSRGGFGWPLPFLGSPSSAPEDEARRSIVKAAPRATTAELASAAQMARLSSLVYHPDPSDRLEALGLELKDCQQTPYTAYFVADGPSELFMPHGQKGKKGKGEGKTRYIITRGVAMDRKEVNWADLWVKLLQFWPVEFEKGLTPRGAELLVHEGVKEIAEQVYASLLPHLAFDPKKDGISAVRFGGHSLGGSLSLLLMLMFHLRSPVKRGYAGDLDFNSHTFGSFPVVASSSQFQLPWEGENQDTGVGGGQGSGAGMCPLMRTLESLRSQLQGIDPSSGGLAVPSCSILANLGLPAGAAQGFVHSSDIVPRAFLALKHDAVRGLLGIRQKLQEGPLGGNSGNPLQFQPVGAVHYMQSQGEEVSVARLQASLAEKVLHMEVGDFVRNPGLLTKSIQDHYFNHYVTGLDSALASARLQAMTC